MAIPFLAVWNLASCSRHEALRMTQVDQSWVLFEQPAFNATGKDHFLESKKLLRYGPENEIAAVTFFTKTSTAVLLQVQQNGRIPGNTVADKVSSPTCMLPIFAKAPCCLELFGCCCRRLSQHGLGEVLILRRHCWPDAFFCVCVGSRSFCHDWGRTAQFCFRLLMRCLFVDSPSSLRPSRLLTHAKGHFVPWQGLGNRSD